MWCVCSRLFIKTSLLLHGACLPAVAKEEGEARAAVIDALVNAQARLLTLPQRNVTVEVPFLGAATTSATGVRGGGNREAS